MQRLHILDNIRIDRTAFSVSSLYDESEEKQYWWSKTPLERIYAVEMMRQMHYGYNSSTTRLQRFFEIAELT